MQNQNTMQISAYTGPHAGTREHFIGGMTNGWKI